MGGCQWVSVSVCVCVSGGCQWLSVGVSECEWVGVSGWVSVSE